MSLPLYLCAHLVHGQPVWDIAEEMDVDCNSDPGPWYITTAGHRIRPYHVEPFNAAIPPPPDDAEDSWTAIREARDDRGILAMIGLAPKPAQRLRSP